MGVIHRMHWMQQSNGCAPDPHLDDVYVTLTWLYRPAEAVDTAGRPLPTEVPREVFLGPDESVQK